MEIKLKYNIGDMVWTMFKNKPKEYKISAFGIDICAQIGEANNCIYYYISEKGDNIGKFPEKDLYSTKQ